MAKIIIQTDDGRTVAEFVDDHVRWQDDAPITSKPVYMGLRKRLVGVEMGVGFAEALEVARRDDGRDPLTGKK